MSALNKIINVTTWILLCTLIFMYSIRLAFDHDPGFWGSFMSVLFINMMAAMNGNSKKD
jgi:hypothetical protein